MEFAELDDLYRETILEHCRNPRNRDKLEDGELTAVGVNPFCGDEIHLQFNLDEEGRIAGVGLQGVGCSINQASGSMLTEVIEGKRLEEVESFSDAFRNMMEADPSTPAPEEVGGLQSLSGVRHFPVRIKCALLAWSTLEEAIEDYRDGHP